MSQTDLVKRDNPAAQINNISYKTCKEYITGNVLQVGKGWFTHREFALLSDEVFDEMYPKFRPLAMFLKSGECWYDHIKPGWYQNLYEEGGYGKLFNAYLELAKKNILLEAEIDSLKDLTVADLETMSITFDDGVKIIPGVFHTWFRTDGQTGVVFTRNSEVAIGITVIQKINWIINHSDQLVGKIMTNDLVLGLPSEEKEKFKNMCNELIVEIRASVI